MDGTFYYSNALACQTDYYNLPTGWELAPPDSDGIRIAKVGKWGTEVVVYSNGDAYWTANSYNGGQFGASKLMTSTRNGAPAYKPEGCRLRVLIRASLSC